MIKHEKLGSNQYKVTVNEVEYYFSYDTVVAFRLRGKLFVSENVWSNTAGKLLNKLEPNKKNRYKFESFNTMVEDLEVTNEN